MSLRERLRTLFRLFLLFTVLAAVALISAITSIRLAIRGRQAAVPKLVGIPLEQAQRTASGLGLELKIEDKLYSTQFAANQVTSQVPAAGTRIKMGQSIHVLVSLGPPRIVAPDVVGSSLRAAQITAVQRGLTVGNVAAVHWPDIEPDQVLAQEPPPSTTEVHSPTLNFLVSLGGAEAGYVCPSFVGKPLHEARRVLAQAGFKLGEVKLITGEGKIKNTILAQSPEPGTRISQETTFSFQVAE